MTFNYVPAGAYPSYTSSLLLFWRELPTSQIDFKTPPKGEWHAKEGYALIKAGDRELLICTKPQVWRPNLVDCSWDGVINTDMYQHGGLGERYLKFALISAHNGLRQKLDNRNFLTSKKMQILGDSGGAQLKFGVSPYVDPQEVINWHNNVVDYGIGLDIVPRPCDVNHPNVMKACADVQRKHNELFLKEKNEKLKLVNIMHGHTLENQLEWYKRSKIDGMSGWAVGADNPNSTLSFIRLVMIPMMRTIKAQQAGKPLPTDSDIFHVLGVGGRTYIPALTWLGKYVPCVTADSTGWLYSVRTKTMEILTATGALKAMAAGASSVSDFYYDPIPCSCEVCSIVKYMSVFNMDTSLRTGGLLAAHNWISVAKYARRWNYLAEKHDFQDYFELLNNSFSLSKNEGPKNDNTPTLMLRYIETVINRGFEAAEVEFVKHLTSHDQQNSTFLVEDGEDLFNSGVLDEQAEVSDRIISDSDQAELHYQDIVNLPPKSYYAYKGVDDDLESISTYAFPYYLNEKEIKSRKLETEDRILGLNNLGLRPKFTYPAYELVVKGRSIVKQMRKRGHVIPGSGPWLDSINDFEVPPIEDDLGEFVVPPTIGEFDESLDL